ncbi:MFS transporter [Gorillibacterium timonense]|uniref:MFS transporter n=1 Tax=Gorillibacterium timonense TaxID=1689269 RepID=UPI00071C8F3E|nr:MFS transporter [Gorillibacterium timonense]
MAFFIMLLINTLHTFGIAATRPIVSIYSEQLGFTSAIIGILVASYSFLPMMIAARTGRWVDRIGARKMVYIGGGGLLTGFLVPILFPTLPALFFSQIILGFSQLFIVLSIQKTVGNMPGERDRLIATHSLSGAIGEMLGPLVSGFTYAHFGFQWAFGVSAFVSLLAILLGLLLKKKDWQWGDPAAESEAGRVEPIWKLLRDVNLRNAILISGVVLYSKELVTAYFPLYGTSIGMTSSSIGLALSISSLMSLVVRFLQYPIIRWLGRSRVMTGTLVVAASAYMLISLTELPVWLGVLLAVMGASLGIGQPLSMVYALDLSPVRRHGEILGLRVSINRVLQFFAPMVFGGIGGAIGLAAIFLSNGAIMLLVSFFTRIDPSIGSASREGIAKADAARVTEGRNRLPMKEAPPSKP